MPSFTHSHDAVLLGLLQEAVPFTAHPFAELGDRCGLDEEATLACINRLKAERVIRQISAIFDTRSLGYASSLVAAKVAPERVDAAAAIISAHPGVSHNYLRNHEFNLWYTIAIPPTSRLGLDQTVDLLHRESGSLSTRLLPTLKLHKIGVRFDVEGDAKPDDQAAPAYSEKNRRAVQALSAGEIALVQAMQRDLAVTPTPFIDLAAELGMPFEELQAMHREFLASGRMRRFAAVLHHRKAGFGANAMGVWAGPQGDPAALEHLGTVMAAFRAVSHCYERPSYPDWPYNLFTMVHGKNEAECEQTLAAIAVATGLTDWQALYSSKEYKKVRVRYFTDAEARWEAAHCSGP
ncbi:MAG: Lrp/AsnC family transcriptional regulator [Verrucomicrobia bacterium]|nr:Lrp/AsnC family transcriptional regulator [Verrucomicrobiota bacterium]